jgi:hypothetical protein
MSGWLLLLGFAILLSAYLNITVLITGRIILRYAIMIYVFAFVIVKKSHKAQVWLGGVCVVLYIILLVLVEKGYLLENIYLYFPDNELILFRTFFGSLEFKGLSLHIACFYVGTIIGQLYYNSGASPLVKTQKLNNSKILKPVLWCGQKVVIIYILYFILTPLAFAALAYFGVFR